MRCLPLILSRLLLDMVLQPCRVILLSLFHCGPPETPSFYVLPCFISHRSWYYFTCCVLVPAACCTCIFWLLSFYLFPLSRCGSCFSFHSLMVHHTPVSTLDVHLGFLSFICRLLVASVHVSHLPVESIPFAVVVQLQVALRTCIH